MVDADVKRRIIETIDADADLSIRNVALRAGLSDSALHKFLTDDDHSMKLKNVRKIAEALGVELRWLMFGEEQPAIVGLWDRIPEGDRPKVMTMLEALAKAS